MSPSADWHRRAARDCLDAEEALHHMRRARGIEREDVPTHIRPRSRPVTERTAPEHYLVTPHLEQARSDSAAPAVDEDPALRAARARHRQASSHQEASLAAAAARGARRARVRFSRLDPGTSTDLLDVVAGLDLHPELGALLLLRHPNPEVPDWDQRWCLPGGKVEAGEAFDDALRREWKEELGLYCVVGPLVHVAVHRVPGYPRPYRVSTFLVGSGGDRPELSPEAGTALCRTTTARISELWTTPGTTEACRAGEQLMGIPAT